MSEINPNVIASHNGQFLGLPYSSEEAEIVILPVPWDVTTSYRAGTVYGPTSVINASYQIDLTSPYVPEAWNIKIHSKPVSKEWIQLNRKLRKRSEDYIAFLEEGGDVSKSSKMQKELDALNEECRLLHLWVEKQADELLAKKKKVVLLGGDHSVSLGLIRALAKKESFSVLHFDAHADLRSAYEGFTYSHASIMDHVIREKNVKSLTQVGIRDLCPEEMEKIVQNEKVHTFFDHELKQNAFQGMNWKTQCQKIIETLSDKVYVSFDIDGLDPKLCPSTGTPVPGGLEYSQALYLIHQVVQSGREIIGADLLEVAPSNADELKSASYEDLMDGIGGGDWNANVGARMLFNICTFLKA